MTDVTTSDVKHSAGGEVVVRAAGKGDRRSLGSEVAVLSVDRVAGGLSHPWEGLAYDESWTCYEHTAGLGGTPLLSRRRNARLAFPAADVVGVRFLCHPWGGMAEVSWGGVTDRVDLYSPTCATTEVRADGRALRAIRKPMGRREANQCLGEYEATIGRPAMRAAPSQVILRTTNVCNVRCKFCFRTALRDVAPDVLSFGEFVGLARRLPLDVAYYFEVSGSGDFSTHPEADRFLRYLEEHHAGLRVRIATNGNLIRDRLWDALENTPHLIKIMHISLNAATADTYTRLTAGGDFDRVIANLRRMGRIRGVSMSGSMVVMDENLHEMPDFVRLCHDLGMERAQLYALIPTRVFGPEHGPMACGRADTTLRLLEDAQALAQECRMEFGARGFVPAGAAGAAPRQVGPTSLPGWARLRQLAQAYVARKCRDGCDFRRPRPRRRETNLFRWLAAQGARACYRGVLPERRAGLGCAALVPCFTPWRLLNVVGHADVKFCCGGARPVGNLHEQSWRAIWNSPLVILYRRTINSPDPPTVCRWCNNVGRKMR